MFLFKGCDRDSKFKLKNPGIKKNDFSQLFILTMCQKTRCHFSEEIAYQTRSNFLNFMHLNNVKTAIRTV